MWNFTRKSAELRKRLQEPQRLISGSIAPSGRFTLGSTPKKLPSGKCKRGNSDEEKLCELQPPKSSVEAGASNDASNLHSLLGENRPQPGRIGSSSPAISDKRGKRGCRGISGSSAAQLKYWLAEFERRHGKESLSFLTLTLPELDPEDRERLHAGWSKVVEFIIRELRRELRRRGARNTTIMGCTEIQEERLIKYGWASPHLHLVFRGKNKRSGSWLLSPADCRELWRRAVESVVKRNDYDFRASENLQRVKHSVSRYLAKYLSKSVSKHRDGVSRAEWHPTNYTILPAAFRKWYRGNTSRGAVVADYLLELMRHIDELTDWWMAPICIESSIGQQIVGWYGYSSELVRHAPDTLLTRSW